MKQASIKVGVIADQTGPLSFVGIANANVAKMVINDINAAGGLLGRQINLYLEQCHDRPRRGARHQARQHDNVDALRRPTAPRQAIKGPAVGKGRKLYIYPGSTKVGCDHSSSAPARGATVDLLIPG